ncbi:histidine protein methyltransferase 1 homolog [Phalaenopsis equestris]|uniref:histidine protein methyltransferase 1 homolog n=1 Tax=Phalaenopsis equestris TaxID=78828 RepID=UPI0009E5DC74|nr:histidine protein methyltransferase 1 homolog [Phalaenopsis equestris]
MMNHNVSFSHLHQRSRAFFENFVRCRPIVEPSRRTALYQSQSTSRSPNMNEGNSLLKPEESYPFFTISNDDQLGQSLGFFGAPQKPPLPPCIEVPLYEPAEVPIKSHTEPIIVCDGHHKLTFLKGRVSTSDVFGVSNSDLVPGKYEGGLKLWEGSIDLIKALNAEIEEGRLTVKGKRVLELGCGHGLPGIFTALTGASTIHFQDFNAEVLRFLTIPNVKANLTENSPYCLPSGKNTEVNMPSNVCFFAGDWSEVHHSLLHGSKDGCQNEDYSNGVSNDGYDIILMAETVYAPSSLQSLYELIKKCLCPSKGIVYVAGKKHYFGVGGGTRQFINLVAADGQMKPLLLAEVADGSSNVREVWKLSNE